MENTVDLTVNLPRSVFAALREDPARFMAEMRLAAAVKWYERRRLSQAKAAEVAGLSRAEFLAALAEFDVTPFQYDADEIVNDMHSIRSGKRANYTR
jgi:predicted HTH domain antitoxin